MEKTTRNLIIRSKSPASIFRRSLLAAAIALCLIVGGSLFLPSGGGIALAYAYGEGQEITSSGATFATGAISSRGELTGHPLIFHLAGEGIETVRFSCKNERLNFIDLTEQRGEYGTAQNFTVPYGANESEYGFLVIDWVPDRLIALLQSGQYGAIAELPEELRTDIIVMEITFAHRKTATKAIRLFLNDDGSIFAAFEDYKIGEEDDFVRRADSQPVDREVFYRHGDISVRFYDKDGGEVLPDAGWYNICDVDHIAVQWKGRFAESVQMFFTPSGTETLEQMELLATRAASNADNLMIFPADVLRRPNLIGHLDFLIDLGRECCIRSALYEVIYDPSHN